MKNKENKNKNKINLKKEFVKYCHDLKKDMVGHEMKKQTAIVSFKELIRKEEISIKELKKLWQNGRKTFSI